MARSPLKAALLADDMGLSKIVTALTFMLLHQYYDTLKTGVWKPEEVDPKKLNKVKVTGKPFPLAVYLGLAILKIVNFSPPKVDNL